MHCLSAATRFLVCLTMVSATCLMTTTAVADFTPISGWDNQLFPSYVVATATVKSGKPVASETVLGDHQGIFGVELMSKVAAKVKVTISCPNFVEPSVFTGVVPAGKTTRIMPKMRYRYDRLTKNHQSIPSNFTFKVELEGNEAEEQIVPITIRSINDCPFLLKEGEEFVDIGFTFAAYVNEQHPFVDKLLREALDAGIVSAFTGYQKNDPAEVLRQVYAVWHALSQRDMRYSSITATVVGSESVGSQNVRLIEESINNAQANCVDGAVLFASVMRKIGIETFLVLTPDHCYVGFYPRKGREGKPLALETVLIGTDAADYEKLQTSLDQFIGEEWQTEPTWRTFAAAVEVGTADYAEYLKKANEKQEIESPRQAIYISDARKAGILPIPFSSKEKYSWAPVATTDSDDVEYEDSDATEETVTVEGEMYEEEYDDCDDDEEDDEEDCDDEEYFEDEDE